MNQCEFLYRERKIDDGILPKEKAHAYDGIDQKDRGDQKEQPLPETLIDRRAESQQGQSDLYARAKALQHFSKRTGAPSRIENDPPPLFIAFCLAIIQNK